MGNAQPKNHTGRVATAQKLANAQKLGILSLSEHNLEQLPPQLFELTKLRVLDLSKNKLTTLVVRVGTLTELKTLNVDYNLLVAGSLEPVSKLKKLQTLTVSHNRLGKPLAEPSARKVSSVHKLPPSIKQLNLSYNFMSHLPPTVLDSSLTKLEKLDLSGNQLIVVPDEIANLKHLQELKLDSNQIVALPSSIGQLSKLKAVSLKDNKISVKSTVFNDTTNIQPLPKSLFVDTQLIDLNLHGNPLTNTILNEFDGFQTFLERRSKVKSKTLSNLDVCGLE